MLVKMYPFMLQFSNDNVTPACYPFMLQFSNDNVKPACYRLASILPGKMRSNASCCRHSDALQIMLVLMLMLMLMLLTLILKLMVTLMMMLRCQHCQNIMLKMKML